MFMITISILSYDHYCYHVEVCSYGAGGGTPSPPTKSFPTKSP